MKPDDQPYNQEKTDLLNEQVDPALSRTMSGDRGPFADKMKDDPFEYEIIGDPCNDPDGIKFKVIGFSSKGKGNKRLVRKFTKITKGPGQRTFAKGKYIWKKGRLKGQDSWIILRDKIGGADKICKLVSEAEGSGEPDSKTDRPKMDLTDKVVPGMKTTNVGGRKDTPEEKPKAKPVPKSASGAKPGTLKYYIENNTTGIDADIKNYSGLQDFVPQKNARKYFRDALIAARKGERNQKKYSPANIGYGLASMTDKPMGSGASIRLYNALRIMANRKFTPGVVDKINDLRSRIFNTVAKKSWTETGKIAQEKSDVLASELNMPFFGTVIAASKEEPAKNKKPKPGPKTKKTDKTDKPRVPTGNLMDKDVDLEGMKMKITSSRLFLDGKPFKAVVDAGLAGNIDLNFSSAKFTSGGDRVFLSGKIVGAKASIAKMAGFPSSGQGEILTKDLVRYAKQLKSKGEVTVTEFDPPLQIVPASMSEALYMSPDQLNMFVLNELKSIGFIEDQKEENMKIAKSRLRQIIKEEIAQTLQEQESDSENLDSLILRIIDASGSKVAALRDATAAIPGEAESLYFDEENDDILLFATRDDMTRWEQAKVAKDQSASQPQAPASQMSMSGDELLASVSVGQPQYRSGGPGRVLHPAEEAESAQEQRDDLVKQWERYKSIPGATISFYKMPDDYKPRDRWDRARAGKLFADVDHPSLD